MAEVPGTLDRYSFAHALIRETLYDELSKNRRARLHRRIGLAVEEMAGDDPGRHLPELAYHFAEAGAGETEKAIDYAARAGEWARAHLAHEEAVDHFGLALEAYEAAHPEASADDRRCSLLLSLGDASWLAGDDVLGKQAFRRAGGVAKARGEAARLARAALGYGGIYVEAGVVDEPLIQLLEDALAQRGNADPALRACLLARLAEALYFAPDRTRAPELSAEAVQLARRSGDRAALAVALNARRLALWGPDDLAERMAATEEILSLASGLDRRELVVGGLTMRGLLSHGLEIAAFHWRLLDRLEVADADGAEAAGAELVRLSEELRSPVYRRFVANWKTVRAQIDGRLEDAEKLATEALRIVPGPPDTAALKFYGAHVAFVRTEQGRAAEIVDMVRAFANEYPAMPVWRAASTNVLLDAGLEEEARREFESLARGGFAAFPRDVFWLTAMTRLAATAARLADRPRAALLYDLLAPYADRNVLSGDALCWGPASHYLGLLATTLGRWERAERHFDEALRMSARLRARGFSADTQSSYAAMLLKRDAPGDDERARNLAASAVATARELGIGRLVEPASKLEPETAAKS